MEEQTLATPASLHTVPRPIAPIWSRAWRGFPSRLGPLVGRTQELATLAALLGDEAHRLVTVTGPGGVGKTRLAVEAAERVDKAFPDGAAFVPLAALDDPGQVVAAIADILDIRESPARPLRDALIGSLRERRVLLLLDNLEHLVGETLAADLSALLQGCPRLTILATSRAPLALRREQRFGTPPLAAPGVGDRSSLEALAQVDAVALFLTRASEVLPGFVLDQRNGADIAEICRRLDGLPLAIELAAAWVRVLSPAALRDRIEPRLPLLTNGPRDQPERLRTMRNAIAWSYELLTPGEQALFRRLAVFSGGFSLEAAEWVGGQASEVGRASEGTLELVAALVDKSLVHQIDAINATPRFAMLETVREYAHERLRESGEVEMIAARHAAFYMKLAEQIEPESLGAKERYWYVVVNAELGNLRAALNWSVVHDPELALRIAAPLWVYWSVFHLAEGRRWLQAGLAQASEADDLLRAKALSVDGALGCLMGDFAASERAAIEGAVLAKGADDPFAEARARWIIGACRFSSGQINGVLEELDLALQLFSSATTSADLTRTAYARSSRGATYLMRGERAQGIADYERALIEVRAVGSNDVAIIILCDFAGWLITLGETDRARQLLAEALGRAADAPVLLLPMTALVGLALVAAIAGDAETAALQFGAIEAMRSRSGLVFPVHYQERLDQVVVMSKASLGDARFATLMAMGRADPDAIITTALEHADIAGERVQHGDEEVLLGNNLSPREREVLRLLTAGQTDREIATALYISMRTASSHVSSILQKLNAVSRAEAAAVAVRAGLA